MYYIDAQKEIHLLYHYFLNFLTMIDSPWFQSNLLPVLKQFGSLLYGLYLPQSGIVRIQ